MSDELTHNERVHFRRVLATLYPDGRHAQRVAVDAQIDPSTVDFTGGAKLIWHDLIAQAEKQGQLIDLLDIARHEYPAAFADSPASQSENAEDSAWMYASLEPPLPPDCLIGHESDVKAIVKGVQQGRVVVLQGMGGLGKSVLASSAVQELSTHYPERIFWLPSDEDSFSVAQQRIVKLAGVTLPSDNRPGSLDSRCVSILRSKQAIVVLDDASMQHVQRMDVGQAEWPRFIVTTRDETLKNRLRAIRRAVVIKPAYLNVEQGVALLAQGVDSDRITRERSAAESLVAALGGLPLAIKLASFVLADARSQSIDHYQRRIMQRLDELATDTLDHEPRNHAMRASIEVSTDRLNVKDREAFFALGLFDSRPFTGEALGSVSACEQVERFERELRRLALIEDDGSHCYRLHPVLTQFAQQRLGVERFVAERRFVQHFVSVASKFEQLNANILRSTIEQLANIRHAFTLARSALERDLCLVEWEERSLARLPKVASAPAVIALATSFFFAGLQTEIGDPFDIYLTGLTAARSMGDSRRVASFLRGIGHIHLREGRFDEAEATFGHVLDIYQRLDDSSGLATAYDDLSVVVSQKGDPKAALELLELAHALDGNLVDGSKRDLAIRWCNQAENLRRVGRLDEALSLLENALRCHLAEHRGDHPDAASVYLGRGLVYRAMNKVTLAMKDYGCAFDILCSFERPDFRLACCWNALGVALKADNRLERAIECFHYAYEIAVHFVGEQHHETTSYLANEGRALVILGEQEEGIKKLKSAYRTQVALLGEDHQVTKATVQMLKDSSAAGPSTNRVMTRRRRR